MARIIRDISLQQFGRLTASFPIGVRRYFVFWACLCDCGNTKTIREDSLRTGAIRSCGCLHRETRKGKFTHGHSRIGGLQSPTYISWAGMIQRCTNPNTARFEHYGGANPPVTVCARWLNSFEAFLEDLGERPEGTTLGRFGDAGNYEPDNCAWQSDREQKAEQKIKRQLKFLAA